MSERGTDIPVRRRDLPPKDQQVLPHWSEIPRPPPRGNLLRGPPSYSNSSFPDPGSSNVLRRRFKTINELLVRSQILPSVAGRLPTTFTLDFPLRNVTSFGRIGVCTTLM